jgi:hypothetical protein
MPSTRSLMRLVPTVTVLAWCLMASTGRDMAIDDSPSNFEKVLSMFSGRALEAEIHFEIGHRQPAGKVFGATAGSNPMWVMAAGN